MLRTVSISPEAVEKIRWLSSQAALPLPSNTRVVFHSRYLLKKPVLTRSNLCVRAFVVGGATALGGDATGGVLGAIERTLAREMTGFTGHMDTVLRGLDYESDFPKAQGAPDLDDVVNAAIHTFPGLLDEEELRDQQDEFAEAAAAAASIDPRDNRQSS